MLKMAVGQTDEVEADLAAAELIKQCNMALETHEPKAGWLLASHDLDLESLVRLLRDSYPNIELIGCTTLAPMSSAIDFAEGSTVLTLFASDVVEFSAGLGRNISQDVGAAAAAALEAAGFDYASKVALCISTPSVEGIDPASVTDELGKLLGPDVPVFGGGAVPDFPVVMPWLGGKQFFGGEILTDALPVLLLSGPLKVSVGVAHGWKGVGQEAIVTKADGNRVYEIDNEPVGEFYRRYLGVAEPALANPLAVHDELVDRYFLRAPMDYDEEVGSATFLGSVPEGATVHIAMASTDEILAGTDSSLNEALAGYPEGSQPEGALIASCAVRNLLLGSRTHDEVERIRDGLGPDTPVSGFYAFGEISPLGEGSTPRFHNETCVTVLLGT
ncbi:MAG: FIST signal transduction protein [Acidimicrobiia bacterium]